MNRRFVILFSFVYLVITAVFMTFPRSTYSVLERRELASFPELTIRGFFDGSFTRDVSSWFSDSEPYRDIFMEMSMWIKQMMSLSLQGDDVLKYHAVSEDNTEDDELLAWQSDAEETLETDSVAESGEIGPYENEVTRNENAKMASSGIIVVGAQPEARALMAFGGTETSGSYFASVINEYRDAFDESVRIYCMVIPNSSAYYVPENAMHLTKDQISPINHIHSLLKPGVSAVDVFTPLAEHASENIFLRTDHHWAPLGAFYAARKFAEVAGVPFRELDSYREHVIHRFVGTMYAYSQDMSIRQSPEDFFWYEPLDVTYNTVFTQFQVDESYRVTSASRPAAGEFFHIFRDGSSNAYLTFMGGDQKIAHVSTSTKNSRRLLILKDSFGNALPGYLFYSFEEIHIVDNRYFVRNIKDYIRENNITDILFANNIFGACTAAAPRHYHNFLSQNGAFYHAPEEKVIKGDSVAADSASVTNPREEQTEQEKLASESGELAGCDD